MRLCAMCDVCDHSMLDHRTVLIAEFTEPSFITLARAIGHAFAVPARFAARRSLLSPDFTVIAAQARWTTARVVANAFAAIHAGYHTFCCNDRRR